METKTYPNSLVVKEIASELKKTELLPPASSYESVVRKSARIKKLLQGKASLRHFMVMHEVLKGPPGAE